MGWGWGGRLGGLGQQEQEDFGDFLVENVMEGVVVEVE